MNNLVEKELPPEHWVCQNCGATKNLIRSFDPKNPTYCKPCKTYMIEQLKKSMEDEGVRWYFNALMSAVEKSTPEGREYIANHLKNLIDERLEDWRRYGA